MLCKKVAHSVLGLEVYTSFDFQLRTQPVLLSFFNSNVLNVG